MHIEATQLRAEHDLLRSSVRGAIGNAGEQC